MEHLPEDNSALQELRSNVLLDEENIEINDYIPTSEEAEGGSPSINLDCELCDYKVINYLLKYVITFIDCHTL